MAVPEGIKGAPDWFPPRSALFDHVESTFLDVARLAGYQRVRTPIFEHTEVFARGVGASTDIVQKEMYTFTDKGGRSLTLRPEGTAGVLRAALEASVPKTGGLPVKYLYAGEFFRQERPQQGRQRQFSQVGVEALGSDDAALDAEVVLLAWEAFRRLGLEDVTLRLNTLGDREDRPAYLERLNAYLDTVDDLPPEVEARRHLNPLRAFDSKAAGMDTVIAAAPLLSDYVSDAAVEHHAKVVTLLAAEGVPILHDARLVRGLDYYTRTTFELQAGVLGAQSAVGGGGRYDGLAEDLGWPDRFPGVGWALGVDRTVLALELAGAAGEPTPRVQAFFAVTDMALVPDAFALVAKLRRAGVSADLVADGRGLRAQLKAADRAGARWAVVLGPAERDRGTVGVRDLVTGEQAEVGLGDLVLQLRAGLGSP